MFCQGGVLQHFKDRFSVKVGFCNNLKDGVLSRWNLKENLQLNNSNDVDMTYSELKKCFEDQF